MYTLGIYFFFYTEQYNMLDTLIEFVIKKFSKHRVVKFRRGVLRCK